VEECNAINDNVDEKPLVLMGNDRRSAGAKAVTVEVVVLVLHSSSRQSQEMRMDEGISIIVLELLFPFVFG
jgi:hypothetical protein